MQTARGASLNDANDTSESPRKGAAGPVHRRRLGVLFAVAATALVLDALSKIAVVARLEHKEPIRLLGGALTLTVSRNSGAAFSIGPGMTIVFTVIAVGVIVAILRTARRLRSLPWAVSLGLLLGGATGNLVDRIVRAPAPMQGHVVDWIELPHWPVFNLADSAIVCGGALAVLLASRGLQIDGGRLRPEQASRSQEAGGGPQAAHDPHDEDPAAHRPARTSAEPAAGAPPERTRESAAPPEPGGDRDTERDAEPGARP